VVPLCEIALVDIAISEVFSINQSDSQGVSERVTKIPVGCLRSL